MLASAAIGRAITALLVGVMPIDPPSFALTSVLLLFVAAAASFVPAMRALRVSPLDALRTAE